MVWAHWSLVQHRVASPQNSLTLGPPIPRSPRSTIALWFLGGLSLHLNHLIAYRLGNFNWTFGTLPFGLFGSNLDTMDLETYPRTYSGHF